MKQLLYLSIIVAVLYLGSFAYASNLNLEAEVEYSTALGAPITIFLTQNGEFDLDAAQASGYQGPLDIEGFEPAIDPVSGQPIFRPLRVKKPSLLYDPDDIYWDNSISSSIPGINGYVNCLTVYQGNLIIGGDFTIAGSVLANNIASWDGSTWSSLASGTDGTVRAFTIYDNQLIVGGSFSIADDITVNKIATWDGLAWDSLESGMNGDVYSLEVYNNQLLAGGAFDQAGNTWSKKIAAWDGSRWRPMIFSTGIGGIASSVSALTVYDNELIIGGCFDSAGGMAANNVAAWDGSSWSTFGSGVDGSINVLATYDNKLIAGGSFVVAGGLTVNKIASWDGSSWASLGSGMGAEIPAELSVKSLVAFDNLLIAGGYFDTAGTNEAKFIASWDGASWSPLGTGMNQSVNALTVYNSQLIAGGHFSVAGGIPVDHIAVWNGLIWSRLGSEAGITGPIYALTIFNNNLIVGGWFPTINGLSVNHIASWNGSSWSSLGDGMDGTIYDLGVYEDKLIAGGEFINAGGIEVNHVASWDGNSWQSIGSGMSGGPGHVWAITTFQNNLIAGGFFANAGGISANNIASWNGSNWSSLGSGTNQPVEALTIYDNNLIVGGGFTEAGGLSANKIASWDGYSWQPLSYGITSEFGYIKTLLVYHNDLIVGGIFTAAGGVSANNIAAWDGSSWSPLGSGLDDRVYCLEIYDDQLMAGGWFTTSDGISVNRVTSWDGSHWLPLGSGMDNNVFDFAVYNSKLIVGGDFQIAGDKVAPYIAQWGKQYPDEVSLFSIKIYADIHQYIGGTLYRAEGNIGFSANIYDSPHLNLGTTSIIEYDISSGNISIIDTENVRLLSEYFDIDVTSLTTLNIDAINGTATIAGELNTTTGAPYTSYISGSFTLDFENLRCLGSEFSIKDNIFGEFSFSYGEFDLNGCPFFGYLAEANIEFPEEFVTPMADQSISLLREFGIDYENYLNISPIEADLEIVLGMFLNSGVVRFGFTGGLAKHIDIFDRELNMEVGSPVSGIVEIDYANKTLRVVDDLTISLGSVGGSGQDRQSNIFIEDENNGEKSYPPISIGLKILGQEKYDDLNCNNIYDQGIDGFYPNNPNYDYDMDGVWDEGSVIKVWDEIAPQPIYIINSAQAEIDLSVLYFIPLTISKLNLSTNLPDDRNFHFDGMSGACLGNPTAPIFDINFGSGSLDLDFDNAIYFGNWELAHCIIPGVTLSGDFEFNLPETTYSMSIEGNIGIGSIDLYTAGRSMSLENDTLFTESNIEVLDIIDFLCRYKWGRNYISGVTTLEGYLGKISLLTGVEFSIDVTQCLRGSGYVKWCSWEECITPAISFYVCSLTDWGIDFPGFMAGLACPANLHLYDSSGNHVGFNGLGGIDLEVPGVTFGAINDTGYQYIYIEDTNQIKNYRLEIEGLNSGEFDLHILTSNETGDSILNISYIGKPIAESSLALIELDNYDWILNQDLDGDGTYESQISPDSIDCTPSFTSEFRFTSQPVAINGDTNATINWETSLLSTGWISYGLTTDFEIGRILDTNQSLNHSIVIPDLTPNSRYFFKVYAQDSTDLIIVSNQGYFDTKFLCGDANSDETVNIFDITALISYLYLSGPPPDPLESGDVNNDGTVNIFDITYLISYLYLEGPEPNCP